MALRTAVGYDTQETTIGAAFYAREQLQQTPAPETGNTNSLRLSTGEMPLNDVMQIGFGLGRLVSKRMG